MKILFIFTLISSSTWGVMEVQASNSPTFSVTPIIPDNQIGKANSYFDLRVFPNEVQTIEVELFNGGSEAIEIYTEMVTAQSNKNGILDYNQSEDNLDKSVIFSFAENSEFDSVIHLAAGEKKITSITIKLPDEKFDGILFGALKFSDRKAEQGEEQQIGNLFSYTVTILLSQNDMDVAPDLNLLDVKAAQSNYKNVIVARIQNPKTTVVSNMSVEASIYTENGTEALFSRKASNLKMAPTSFLPFHLETSDKPLQAGKYRLEMSAVIGQEEWTWNEMFTIDAKTAQELNESAIGLVEDRTLLYIGIGVAALVIIAGLSYFIFKNHQKKKRLEEERLRRRKKRKAKKSSKLSQNDSNKGKKKNTNQKKTITSSTKVTRRTPEKLEPLVKN